MSFARQDRNDAEEIWLVLEKMVPEDREQVADDGSPEVTPRLAGYVCKLLALDEVNHWERFTGVPVSAVHRLVRRYQGATTEQARGAILANYQRKWKTPFVGTGWEAKPGGLQNL